MAKNTSVTAIAGIMSVSVTLPLKTSIRLPPSEVAGDGADLERDHEESGGAPGLRRAAPGAATAVENERDLERQPHHVEALQCERDEVGREVCRRTRAPSWPAR